MFHHESRCRSATNCGINPQGKGREGKWKGERRTHHPLLTTDRRDIRAAAAVSEGLAMDGAARWGGEW